MSHSTSTPCPSTHASSPAATDGAGTVSSPVELSAERLHDIALEAFRVGNRGRLSLCDVLGVLAETRLYFDLGFPNLPAYADAHFQLRRSEAFEYVRVAGALVELTEPSFRPDISNTTSRPEAPLPTRFRSCSSRESPESLRLQTLGTEGPVRGRISPRSPRV